MADHSTPTEPTNVSENILGQIRRNWDFEPMVLPAGLAALPTARTFRSSDIESRSGFRLNELLREIPKNAGAIIILPSIVVGGAEKYAIDIAVSLRKLGVKNISFVITDQSTTEISPTLPRSIEKIFDFSICMISDFMSHGRGNPNTIARLLHVVSPDRIIVVNSSVGMRAIERYGRALSSRAKLFCAYFSEGVHGVGGPYGNYFPRRTAHFAGSLTDNAPMAGRLTSMHGILPSSRVHLIPSRMEITPQMEFEQMVLTRLARLERRPSRPLNWVWVSRSDPYKGIETLLHLARLRPADNFHVFTPGAGRSPFFAEASPNVKLSEAIDVASHNWSRYDAFLFTSRFEGQPNIVLEMTQFAIPIISTDVGGLRETLGGGGALLVAVEPREEDTAARMSELLEKFEAFEAAELGEMLHIAQQRVALSHSPSVHEALVSQAMLEDRA